MCYLLCTNFIYPAKVSGRFIFLLLLITILANSLTAQDKDSSTDEAVALFNQGQDAHEKGDLETAIKLYEKAVAALPEFPEAYLQKGSAQVSLGRLDDAEQSFRKAVELRADWTLAMANLGNVLVDKELYSEAERLLTRALELDEMNFPAFTALADLRLKTNANTQILAGLLEKAKVLTAKAKPMASVWAARAALEKSLRDLKASKLSVARALEIEPKNRSAHATKFDLALLEGDIAAAREILKILEKSPQFVLFQARLLITEGKSGEAIDILNAVKNPSAAIIKLRDDLTAVSSEKIPVLEQQLATDPKNPIILGRLCSLFRTEDPVKALEYCRRASEAEPSNINHAVGYGAALVQAKQYVQAVTLLRKILDYAPDNSTVHANLATALFQLKRFPEAKIEYAWLIGKQPTLAVAYYFLAITHDHLSEYLDAMANYQHFLKLADVTQHKLEIEKVNLRLPKLEKQIKSGKGKRK